ncbi:MAG: Alpha/beta hydrolase family protein, partial [Planctomycetaceae bacterium]|nr:Alpha/beta hydrolase family protein [Planctomycetaceae bacterium]
LLFAEHDPRVAGCIAFAPETNVNADGTIQSVDNNGSMPGIYGFSQRSSPLSHLAQLKCPVFLFHARDDSVVPMKQIEEFVSQLKTFNNHVTFQPEDTGEHYDGMIQVGLGTAVEWLSTQGMSK